MKILLLGATGRTGKLIMKMADQFDLEFHCIVRNKQKLPSSAKIKVWEGDVRNKTLLEEAIQGCEGIINVLSISRKSDFAWSKLVSPKDLMSTTMEQLIPLAEKHKIRKFVLCSAWGVGDSMTDIPSWFAWVIKKSNVKWPYIDHEKQENMLKQSKLTYTIVRPVGLNNSTKKEEIKETFIGNGKIRLTISRNSVAQFLIQLLSRTDLNQKTVVLSKK